MKRVIFMIVLMMATAAIYAQYGVDGSPLEETGNAARIWQIIGGVLLVAGMFFARQMAVLKAKAADFMFLIREALDLLQVVLDAVADNTITAEEQARIRKEAMELKAAWYRLIGK